jgi:hypothetical protein
MSPLSEYYNASVRCTGLRCRPSGVLKRQPRLSYWWHAIKPGHYRISSASYCFMPCMIITGEPLILPCLGWPTAMRSKCNAKVRQWVHIPWLRFRYTSFEHICCIHLLAQKNRQNRSTPSRVYDVESRAYRNLFLRFWQNRRQACSC